jgi:hypothetical protein
MATQMATKEASFKFGVFHCRSHAENCGDGSGPEDDWAWQGARRRRFRRYIQKLQEDRPSLQRIDNRQQRDEHSDKQGQFLTQH